MRASFRGLPVRSTNSDQAPVEKPPRILWRFLDRCLIAVR